eukprot:gene29615-51639_t
MSFGHRNTRVNPHFSPIYLWVINSLNFRNLDLNLLRVFDEVMTERNLTRAAHNLAMTQPAVSNAMRRLREVVGDDLVRRSGYGVEPTPLALSLWPSVRDALHLLRDLRHQLACGVHVEAGVHDLCAPGAGQLQCLLKVLSHGQAGVAGRDRVQVQHPPGACAALLKPQGMLHQLYGLAAGDRLGTQALAQQVDQDR